VPQLACAFVELEGDEQAMSVIWTSLCKAGAQLNAVNRAHLCAALHAAEGRQHGPHRLAGAARVVAAGAEVHDQLPRGGAPDCMQRKIFTEKALTASTVQCA